MIQSTRSRTQILLPVAAVTLAAPALGQPKTASADGEGSEQGHASLAPERSAPDPDSITRAEAALAETPAADALKGQLDEVLSGRILGSSTTAVYVVDASSGEAIYEHKIDEALNPASNVKLVATATALDVLGPGWRYKMRVFGPVPREGRVAGDLYLRGGADPTLRARDITELAGELASAGIERVEGDILLGPYRVRDAVGLAPVKVRVSGNEKGEPPDVEVGAATSFFDIENEAKTVGRGRTRLRMAKDESSADDPEDERAILRIRGRIREGRQTSRTHWIKNRAGFTAHAFRSALDDAGVAVQGELRREGFDDYSARAAEAGYLPIELARHESAPMREIIARVNKPSNNFLADRVAMTAGAKRNGGTLSMHSGLAAMDNWLARRGLDPEAIVLDTGSGLSYDTEFSARHVVEVLRAGAGYKGPEPALSPEGARLAAAGSTALSEHLGEVNAADAPSADDIHPAWTRSLGEASESFASSLPVAGVDGTLGSRFRQSAARERVSAKTGTLTNIIALSGFISEREDNEVSFAIITNEHRRGFRTAVRKEHARIVELIYDYLEERRRPERNGDPTLVGDA